MLIVGIDLGTTNIGLTAINLKDGIVQERFSAPNVRVSSPFRYAYLQNPKRIYKIVESFLKRLATKPASIGITGQVHGILYVDSSGNALSKLYTWLDQRGVEPINGHIPQNDLIERCGKTLPAGYGLLTHYANRQRGEVPDKTEHILGICEYVTGRLLKKTLRKTDQSCLSAFGAWDTVNETHYDSLLDEILPPGSPSFLSAAAAFEQAGKTEDGIPVSYPVGDNQAGFFGNVCNWETDCLVSIGTSGQLTVFSKKAHYQPPLELRPFLGIGYLQVGATLSAGKSYEVIEKFILSIIQSAGLSNINDEFVYSLMKKSVESSGENSLSVIPTFKGTRSDSSIRGTITGIGLDNFNIGNLVRGTIAGIVRELYQFRIFMGTDFNSINKIIVTGNVVKNNPIFVDFINKQFALDITVAEADAAVGAALIGAVSAGVITIEDRIPLLKKIMRNIKYKIRE